MNSPAEPARQLATALLHQPHWPAAGFDSVQPGLFRASTVFFPDTAAWRRRNGLWREGFVYGAQGTPTTFELEARIAALEGGTHALLCPSGLAAIALVYLALLAPGDEVLVPANVYPAHRTLLTRALAGWGLRAVPYDPTAPASLVFSERSRLLWVEAPCSITHEFPDLPALAAAAAARGVLVALDNTWGAGIAFAPFALGADLSVQALGKYASGSGEVVMGSVSTRDAALRDALQLAAMRLGLAVSPADAADVLRGLHTLPLRYAAQDRSARRVAAFLAQQAAVARVLHPAQPEAEGHALWARHCRAAAGVLSIVLRGGTAQAEADGFIDALRLFRIGFGWGGPISLVLPPDDRLVPLRPLQGPLVRLSIGLEAADDLIADLAQALARLARA